jgi:vacuolar-type H+-ATPase subunit H
MSRVVREGGSEVPVTGRLARLLEVEERLRGELERAESEARRIVEAARAAAAELEGSLEAEVEAAVAEVARRIEEEKERAVAEIRDETRRRIERFEDPDPVESARLLDRVVERVIAPEPEGERGSVRGRPGEAGR